MRIVGWLFALLLFAGVGIGEEDAGMLPEGFCDATAFVEGLALDLRYAGEHNFVGRPIAGYETVAAIMTEEAAQALAKAQEALREKGYCLVLYDAYRPQRAVDDFASWAEDLEDQRMKADFYPQVEKAKLFEAGYIARHSGHSRGSTVDVGLLDAQGREVDMGCAFDFFGPLAAHGARGLSPAQEANRALLKEAMEASGFAAYRKEWWHYTLRHEPFPDTYFDFPIRTGSAAQGSPPESP